MDQAYRVSELPPCGIYRTLKPIGSVEAGRLVYFHNHGDPGPGLYFPERWAHNRAQFSQNGMTVPDNFDPAALQALPAEGFYRVNREFYCCEKKCTKFEPEVFVQVGYNGNGKAIVFIPELGAGGLTIPERGSVVDDNQLKHLSPLKVPTRDGGGGDAKMDLSLPKFIVH